MATDMLLAVFEDFNDRRDEPVPPAEDEQPAFDEIGVARETAWTEGYMTGRQDRGPAGADPLLTAKLLTSVHDLNDRTDEAVEAAALAVADLLVNTVIAVTSDDWSARLLDRVRLVAARIKPALTVEPAFELRDADGTVRRFDDISALSRALEAGGSGEDVTIRWRHGEARISRTAVLEDLREAIVPLSAGLLNEPGPLNEPVGRNPT